MRSPGLAILTGKVAADRSAEVVTQSLELVRTDADRNAEAERQRRIEPDS